MYIYLDRFGSLFTQFGMPPDERKCEESSQKSPTSFVDYRTFVRTESSGYAQISNGFASACSDQLRYIDGHNEVV